MSRLPDNLLIFGRILRVAGFLVHPGRLADLVEALRYVDLGAREEVYHACRTLLVHRQEQIAIFDLAFAAFWREHHGGRPGGEARATRADDRPAVAVRIEDVPAPDGDDAPDSAAAASDRRVKVWSGRDTLARKDFAAFTADELAEARAALVRLVWQPGTRRTRRWVRGRGARVDLRRAIAESLRSGGDVVKLPRRRRRVRPRPLVLLCDVSGSMERYSRMLLHFAHAVSKRHRRTETFLFATRLTRITRQLRVAGGRGPRGAVRVGHRLVGRDADWRRHEERVPPNDGAAASCTAGRSPCSCPTGGTAIRRSSVNRSRDSSEAVTGRSG
jgi:uncharacterized protein with von Willebrand factor type A (vWA) domain